MTAPATGAHTSIGVLVLAAGRGQRLGGQPKCLLEVAGCSILQRLARFVHNAGLPKPVVVLGHHATAIQNHLAHWPPYLVPHQVLNETPDKGVPSSLHTGLRALHPDTRAVMVLLGDQPLIDAADLRSVLQAFHRRPASSQVLIPTANGLPGHPVMFDASVRTDLLSRPGTSLAEWRRAHPHATLCWETGNTHLVHDLDTPGDVLALARETGWSIRWPQRQEVLANQSAPQLATAL